MTHGSSVLHHDHQRVVPLQLSGRLRVQPRVRQQSVVLVPDLGLVRPLRWNRFDRSRPEHRQVVLFALLAIRLGVRFLGVGVVEKLVVEGDAEVLVVLSDGRLRCLVGLLLALLLLALDLEVGGHAAVEHQLGLEKMNPVT